LQLIKNIGILQQGCNKMLYLLVHQQSLLWLKLVYNKDSQNIAFSFQVCATYLLLSNQL